MAQQLLEKIFEMHGQKQNTIVPGFFTHQWRPIYFKLVVDDFGVKYTGKEHEKHLVSELK